VAFAITVLTFAAKVSFAGDAKVPTTVEEHQAMAKDYKEQATKFKKLADEHRAMAAAYAAAHVPTNGPTPNVGTEKMKKHCEAIAKDADKLAHDAEMAAAYHEQRAKELQGK
jgi:hypothetical protein